MSHPIEVFAASTSILLGWIAGIKVGDVVAQASHAPDWTSTLLGPMGALVGVLVALKWMAGRLARAEEREELRRAERAAESKAERETLIALIRDMNSVTAAATAVMQDVKTLITIRSEISPDPVQSCHPAPANKSQ